MSRQTYTNTASAESSDLADHVGSIQSSKEFTEVTLIYSDENEAVVAAASESVMLPADISIENLSTKQKECPDFKHLYGYIESRQVPDDPLLARVIVAEAYNYELEDGILKHFYSKRSRNVPAEERLVKQTAIPVILRDDILKSYHDCLAGGGHQGFERTYAAIRNKYFWPCMYEDVRQYVKTCEICQQSKRAFNAKPPPLQPQPVDDVFSRWHMDILSGLPTTKEKYKHVLLVVDSYSKWCECIPLRTQEATEVASVLFREIISRYGAPRVLVSDRGKNFMSNLVKALSELFEIKRTLTSAYHPMTNGLVESKNSFILQALRAYCKGQQDDWPELLPGIMMAYLSTPATQSTDFSPFFLLYGREMRLPIDTVLQPKDHLNQDYKVHLGRVLQNLEICRKLAGENIKAAQEKYKYQHDKYSQLPKYRPAQRVWLYCTKVPQGKAPKLHRKWVGPYYITMIGPNHTFRLRNAQTNLEVKSLVNAARLKPYFDPADRPTNPPEDLADHEAELDPEQIELPNDQPQHQNNSNEPIQKGNISSNGNSNNADNANQSKRPTNAQNKIKTPKTPKQPENPVQTNQTKQNQMTSKSKLANKNKNTNLQTEQKHKATKSKEPPKSEQNKQMQQQKPKPNEDTTTNTKTPSVKEKRSAKHTSSNDPAKETQQQGKTNKVPSCKDCKANKCKPFLETEFKSILASNRSNKAIYYKVKLQNNTTNWFFPCKIPSHLIRQFHTNRTMSGKKRKKPLKEKQHKFFKEADEAQVNLATKKTRTHFHHRPKLIGFKILNNRSYYYEDSGDTQRWLPITEAHTLPTDLVTDIINQLGSDLLMDVWETLPNIHNRQDTEVQKFPSEWFELNPIHEMKLHTESGNWECLVSFTKPELTATWLGLHCLPTEMYYRLARFIEDEHKTYVGKPIFL